MMRIHISSLGSIVVNQSCGNGNNAGMKVKRTSKNGCSIVVSTYLCKYAVFLVIGTADKDDGDG